MDKIGIVFAMNEELEAFTKLIKIKDVTKLYDLSFYRTIIENYECLLVVSGVGKVNAARVAQILIDCYKVTKVLNVGVAGGISDELEIGDVVIGESLVQHDFDITVFKHEKGYIPNVGVLIPSDKNLLKIAQKCCEKKDYHTFTGIIASGDIFCTKSKMKQEIFTNFKALCVEMEGAAVAQVCYLSGVPFLILRAISDVLNDNNAITHEQFLDISSLRIATFLLDFIQNI